MGTGGVGQRLAPQLDVEVPGVVVGTLGPVGRFWDQLDNAEVIRQSMVNFAVMMTLDVALS